MMNKPEEVIMACLAALWVVITYVLIRFTGAQWSYVLMVTGFTAVWAFVAFVLWQAGRIEKIYPLLIGALVAFWWPLLDWFSVRGVVATPTSEVVMLVKPWYASWWFKLVLAVAPVVLGYVRMWRKMQKPKF